MEASRALKCLKALYPTSIIVLVYLCNKLPEDRSTFSMAQLSFAIPEHADDAVTMVTNEFSVGVGATQAETASRKGLPEDNSLMTDIGTTAPTL
jgi:hypothetical protein